MRCLVTGVAGFIGSHLAEALLARGDDVLGVDNFERSYDESEKRRNLSALSGHERFEFRDGSVVALAHGTLTSVDAVFHLAAVPGVRRSWGRNFLHYVENNVVATQVLLEASRGVGKFVFASSSSVYGVQEDTPTSESAPLAPISPYGVTKLAAERLVIAYASQRSLPACCLRLFTVYGPRQRPDMALRIFFEALRRGERLVVFGDGRQTRDFTYVGDVVSAFLLALDAPDGSVFNVGSGRAVSLVDAVSVLGEAQGVSPVVEFREPAMGDPRDTLADNSLIREALGWEVATPFEEGVSLMKAWLDETAADLKAGR